jgi:DNA polymerase III subunit delta'
VTHPREMLSYEGGEGAQAALDEALSRGRLHHAWLLTGPEGVGKATFAYRAARQLLGARGHDAEDPVVRQIAAQSHPDLLVLEREPGKKNIPVDEARRLPEFFSKAPASAPYRVAIIDAADDLNANSANAVLKTLEEPPERGVLFLISHAPGRLLPTIRSRCRKLSFPAWPMDRAAAFVRERLDIPEPDAERLADIAKGAPGMALVLAAEGALELDDRAREMLRGLSHGENVGLMALAESFRGQEGARRFEILFERLADRVRQMSVDGAMAGDVHGLDRWAKAWERLIATPREVEAVNLDRADAFWTAVGELRAAARA